MSSIQQALREASSFLLRQGVPAPRNDAELLLAFLLQKERLYLYAYGEKELSPDLEAEFKKLLLRRGKREPLNYITGRKEFMGLSFHVGKESLIPRPETEHLVEAAIRWTKKIFPSAGKGDPLRILDLGTGCGNIAVSLAYYLPCAFLVGVDLSVKVLELAALNARRMGVQERVCFLCGNYWQALTQPEEKYHVIVSNPPYIPSAALPFLPPEVQKEPFLALNGGTDGLEAYRQIFKKIKKYLHNPGFLGLEVGRGQAEAVLEMGYSSGLGRKVEVVRDYAGIERVVMFLN